MAEEMKYKNIEKRTDKSDAMKSMTAGKIYQKEWFKSMQERTASGEPLAYLNADVPMEILRAMDIPFVVNQWWSATCAAKRLSGQYFEYMRQHGLRDDLCNYCSQCIGSAMEPDQSTGPWGGLPKPTFAITRLTCDSQGKIFELFAKEHGAELYMMENTTPIYPEKGSEQWWIDAKEDWERVYESDRLDDAVEEMWALIHFLEDRTGKTFDMTKLAKVQHLINEQEEWFGKTRDLIASAKYMPVSTTELSRAMVGQWQRGTQWGVDFAKSIYEEVAQRVAEGHRTLPNERIRLMWCGRGLWFNMAFLQAFEEKYGAVFVGAGPTGFGADAYIRYHVDEDPLRSLAARFVGMEDWIHMPPWNYKHKVAEAKQFRADGIVYLVGDSCMMNVEGSSFIIKAFEDAGIPVFVLRADNVDPKQWREEQFTREVGEFIEKRIYPKKGITA